MNRLLGVSDESFDEQMREYSMLRKVDMILEKIILQSHPEDNFIIFSDNGPRYSHPHLAVIFLH